MSHGEAKNESRVRGTRGAIVGTLAVRQEGTHVTVKSMTAVSETSGHWQKDTREINGTLHSNGRSGLNLGPDTLTSDPCSN